MKAIIVSFKNVILHGETEEIIILKNGKGKLEEETLTKQLTFTGMIDRSSVEYHMVVQIIDNKIVNLETSFQDTKSSIKLKLNDYQEMQLNTPMGILKFDTYLRAINIIPGVIELEYQLIDSEVMISCNYLTIKYEEVDINA